MSAIHSNDPPGQVPVNVAARLVESARRWPDAPAVIVPEGTARGASLLLRARREPIYRRYTFRELNDDSYTLARGLQALGAIPGTRLALLVRPGFDFISLTFALFKIGAVSILIDPGMGRRNVLRCLDEVEPQGFVAVPVVQAIRTLLRRRYPLATINVTAGRRWFWGGATLRQLRQAGASPAPTESPLVPTRPDDPAAIIFTTGSTGPPKGVLYRHGNFARQVDEIRDAYGIESGEVDVACFPLFALFNCALGVTTVVPRMDFSHPAAVDPRNIIGPINDLGATQAFASPAVWDRVGRYCERRAIRLPSLRRVLSAGAPVSAAVLRRMKECIHPAGDVHTPYGATEALPVATIAASEVLIETAARTAAGAGVCVGRRFPGIEWKIIRFVDGPLATLAEAKELPCREIGELIVRGPVVTREYYRRPQSNALGKIADGSAVWHRMGDVGYLDEHERFWYCGRLAHRVLTAEGPMFTIPCEAIFNAHADVFRSALVGVGPAGRHSPVIIVQPEEGRFPRTSAARTNLIAELRELALGNELTKRIERFLIHPNFPVDIRHNAKIFREKLAVWAARRVPS